MQKRVKKMNRTQRDSNTSSGLCIFFQFIMTSNNQQTVQTRQGDKIVNYSKKSAAQVIGNGDWKCEMEFKTRQTRTRAPHASSTIR